MENIFLKLKTGLTVILVVELIMVLSFNNDKATYATGDGSPAECENPNTKSEGSPDLLTVTAPGSQTVSGVCIKSGTNMFGGTSHSGLLDNGTFETGCYSVSGVGTNTVTVTRIGNDSPTCQGLSHIDVFFSPEASPTPTPTPTPTSTPAGEALGAEAELPETGTPIAWPISALITMISGTYLTVKGLKEI